MSAKKYQAFYNNNKYKYSNDWINKLETNKHWNLYWNQLSIIIENVDLNDTILEIGKGSGITSNYLLNKGYKVTTFDIDNEKEPDIVGNLVEHSFSNSYDIILAFQVLEHIPYEEMESTLIKIRGICNKKFIISVPMNKKTWFTIDIHTLVFSKKISFSSNRNNLTTPHHYWEIGYDKYTLKRFCRSIENSGLLIAKRFRIDNNLFFVLNVSK